MPMSILDNIYENQAIPTINANGAKLRRNKYNFALQSLRSGNSIFRFSPDTRGVLALTQLITLDCTFSIVIYSQILMKSSLPYFAKARTISGRALDQD